MLFLCCLYAIYYLYIICILFVYYLFMAPVVRRDAFYALLFCLAVRVYVSFSPRLSRGLTGWVGGGVRVGGAGGGA